mgnify:CR=1 FL=1
MSNWGRPAAAQYPRPAPQRLKALQWPRCCRLWVLASAPVNQGRANASCRTVRITSKTMFHLWVHHQRHLLLAQPHLQIPEHSRHALRSGGGGCVHSHVIRHMGAPARAPLPAVTVPARHRADQLLRGSRPKVQEVRATPMLYAQLLKGGKQHPRLCTPAERWTPGAPSPQLVHPAAGEAVRSSGTGTCKT